MNSTTTAITLRDTGHILATYTQNSGNNLKIASEESDRRFVNGLQLRLLPPSVVPHSRLPNILSTASDLTAGETEITVKAESKAVSVRKGDQFDVTDGTNAATFLVKDVAPVAVEPFQAKLKIKFLLAPTGDIAENAELFPVQQNSPQGRPFTFLPRYFESTPIDPSELPLISRPTSLSLNEGKVVETPQVGEGIKSIKFEVTQTGVKVTLQPFNERSTTPPNVKLIAYDTAIVCVMLTSDSQNVVSSVEVPANLSPGEPATATIPFAVIPGGDNYFLFMLKGFQPIWDKLKVDETRTWTPTSK